MTRHGYVPEEPEEEELYFTESGVNKLFAAFLADGEFTPEEAEEVRQKIWDYFHPGEIHPDWKCPDTPTF